MNQTGKAGRIGYAHQIANAIIEGKISINICKNGTIRDTPTILRLSLTDKSTLILQFDQKTFKLTDKYPYLERLI